MEYSDENRRYLAKVSRIGMIAAILYALLHAVLAVLPVYGFKFRFYLLTVGSYNVIPELAVAAVGLAALLVCGVLSLILRGKPAVAQKGWIIAGKAVLLAAPVGYIRSQLLRYGMNLASSPQLEFLFSFAILATVFVGYAWSMRPHDGRTDRAGGVRPRSILRHTAMVGGIMLASLLWLLLLQWKSNMSLVGHWSVKEKLEYLLWMPLRATLPVALAVPVGYLLLSLAPWLDGFSRRGRFGKGTLLLGWVALGVGALGGGVSILVQSRMLSYTASDLMGGLGGLQKLQNWQPILSTVATLLGVWTLCRILSHARESRAVVWGTRGVLGVVALRCLSDWIVDAVAIMIVMKKLESSGMGIIGGADVTVTLFTARVNSWLSMLFALLSVAALCVLTVGFVRHCRVSKAFGAVPILTAASVLLPIAAQLLWELTMRRADPGLEAIQWFSLVFVTGIPTVMLTVRSLIGLLTLTRAPARESSLPPEAEGEERPKPRVEDYLFRL